MFNNIIPASILDEMIKEMPYQYAMEFPPIFELDEKYMTSETIQFSMISETGAKVGSTSTVDHPSFDNLRTVLASRGYIDKITTSWNGDTVLKAFYLNKKFFAVGERFLSASAMRMHLKLMNRKSPWDE